VTGPVDRLLAALEHQPPARLQVDRRGGSAAVRVGAGVVARIDLRRARVLVDAPADRIPTLRALYPSSRPARGGIVFHLGDSGSYSEALAAIRRRARVQRFVGQFRSGSP
jgi:hypothetical protein